MASYLSGASPLMSGVLSPDDTDVVAPESVVRKPMTPWAPEAPPVPEPMPEPMPAKPITPEPAPRSIVEKPAGDYYAQLGRQESGGDPRARSKTSSAGGLFQFTEPTWRTLIAMHPELGLTVEDRMNPEAQEKAIRPFTEDNAKILANHGIEVNPANLYITHFLGAGAGPQFIRLTTEQPNAPAADFFPRAAYSNKSIFFDKNGQPRTLAQVYQLQTRRFTGGSVDLGGAAPETPPSVPGAVGPVETIAGGAQPGGAQPGEAPEAPAEEPPPLPGAIGKVEQIGLEAKAGKTGKAKTGLESFDAAIDQFMKMALGWGLHGVSETLHPVESAKGVASGAAQTVTGLGEVIPGPIGDVAAGATRELKKIGSPYAQQFGYGGAQLGEMLAGGEALGALKGAKSLVGLGESSEVAPTVLGDLAKTTAGGVTLGGVSGLQTPTGEESYAKRIAEKAAPAAIGAGLGLVPGVVGAAVQIPGALRTAAGGRATALAEDLRGSLASKFGAAIEEKGREAGWAQAAAIKKGAEFNEHTTELERLRGIQQEIADRDKTIARVSVSDRMFDQLKSAKEAARKSGLSAADAEKFAVQEQQRLTQAEQQAERIVQEQVARPSADPKVVGDRLQRAARDIYSAAVAARSEASGIGEIIADAPREPNIGTGRIIDYVDSVLPDISKAGDKAVLRHFSEEARTALAEEEPVAAVNLAKLESLRKDVASALQTKTMSLDGVNVTPVTKEAAHHLAALYRRVMETVNEASPELAEGIREFRRLSRPLDEFERKGALKDVIARDMFGGDFTMGEADVATRLLNKAGGGQPAISRLIQDRPELRDSMRLLFNRKLFGYADNRRAPTTEQFGKFLEDNKNALEQSGLYDEFSSLKSARETSERAVDLARMRYDVAQETHKQRLAPEIKKVEEKASSAEKSVREMADIKVKAQQAAQRYEMFTNKIKTTPAKEVAGKTEAFADDMFKEGYIDMEQHRQLLEDLQAAKREFEKTTDARRHLKQVLYLVGGTLATAEAARMGISHLRKIPL